MRSRFAQGVRLNAELVSYITWAAATPIDAARRA